jgi:hypothetical protein
MIEKEGEKRGEEGEAIDEQDSGRKKTQFMKMNIGKLSKACTISDKDDEEDVDQDDQPHIEGVNPI